MDMEISKPTNVSWLRFPPRQAVAKRPAMASPGIVLGFSHPNRLRAQRAKSSNMVSLPVPMLEWPPGLFQDENLDN
jgi:hypothetical protein